MAGSWWNLDRTLDYILKETGSKNIIIVGAGNRGRSLARKLMDKGVTPIGFFDNNLKKKGELEVENISVYIPTKLQDNTNYIVAVDDKLIQQQLKNQLLELGISESVIYLYDGKNYGYWKNLKPEEYKNEISVLFKETFGREMNWDNPRTYNEKINWEKLNVKDPIRTKLADKYLVREWIKEKIGAEYLNTFYGVWDNANDIDFELLPNSFVLKCNHGSGWNIIVKDKKELDIEATRKQLNTWLEMNTAYMGFEMQYKDIPPKIICEGYLEEVAESVYDYNIYCFHGNPKYIWCIKGSHRPGCMASFYDVNWKMQEFSYGYPLDPIEAPRPSQLNKMLELSKILCKDFEHVRVDWYNMPDGRIIFGEMTFSTWNGLNKFEPEEWDLKFGDLI